MASSANKVFEGVFGEANSSSQDRVHPFRRQVGLVGMLIMNSHWQTARALLNPSPP